MDVLNATINWEIFLIQSQKNGNCSKDTLNWNYRYYRYFVAYRNDEYTDYGYC